MSHIPRPPPRSPSRRQAVYYTEPECTSPESPLVSVYQDVKGKGSSCASGLHHAGKRLDKPLPRIPSPSLRKQGGNGLSISSPLDAPEPYPATHRDPLASDALLDSQPVFNSRLGRSMPFSVASTYSSRQGEYETAEPFRTSPHKPPRLELGVLSATSSRRGSVSSVSSIQTLEFDLEPTSISPPSPLIGYTSLLSQTYVPPGKREETVEETAEETAEGTAEETVEEKVREAVEEAAEETNELNVVSNKLCGRTSLQCAEDITECDQTDQVVTRQEQELRNIRWPKLSSIYRKPASELPTPVG
ncbi:hypothetical protein BOTBODRAFT_42103 [Botryobasidium botryosum FD-172 SS1]|uniref:Uncharacterized protein n=1 Tax=Botryobasidium botryosum (strain FD-172 SS1) TaxID=930990 RepID=A0A067MRY8_BOTB1|nr:hypothetical protein BOTBODRAFT_42103 [Botryobasidium botryosum FD-172 SS1]